MSKNVIQSFSLEGKVIAITGGAGFVGVQHAKAVVEAGGIPVLLDINREALEKACLKIKNDGTGEVYALHCDITNKADIKGCLETIIEKFGHFDGLVNNAANDPKVGPGSDAKKLTRFENMSLDYWNADISVGLTGAFLCAQVFGHHLATNGGGVIVNIASDLALIAPDQRIYEVAGVLPDAQPVKPVTYSVVKSGLVGLTKYLATYWAEMNVRVNAISPGGIYNNQDPAFIKELAYRIPMGRMAREDENKAALVYLLSDASSYVTGFNLVVDGGRTCW
ncbi:MAG: SDR family oxidoreductase [Legionella sp.]|nr:SDR family oxidoreductase [Legionella sp.]